MYCTLHNTSTGVDIFFSLIFSYFCFLVAALSPCHGRQPLLKYMSTYPRDSISSRRDCSIPRCAFIEAYRAVPVRFLSSRYRMCCRVRVSRNFFASPKSIRNNLLQCRPMPIRKLSGLMSRWMNDLQCTNSTRLIIWSASINTVLIVNRREQKLNRSSSEGPSKSITSTLCSLSCP